MKVYRRLALAKLDKTLNAWLAPKDAQARFLQTPVNGWARTIREGLGMSRRQLARRLRLSPSGIEKLEQNELKKTITIRSLGKLAHELGCDAAVVFIPRQSMQDFALENAKAYVRKNLNSITEKLALDIQVISENDLQEKINIIAEDLLRSGSSKIWND